MPSEIREVLFEFYQVGNAVKVSAVDPETMTEVAIVGPPHLGEETLKLAALRKLDYVLGGHAERSGTSGRRGRA